MARAGGRAECGLVCAVQPYRNLSGDSGVVAYEARPDSIAVRFRDGATYLYTYAVPGREAVEEMKRLARAGRGLSGFVSRQVGGRYAEKR